MYDKTADRRDGGFDNAAPDASRQLDLLSEILDEETFAVLDGVGIGPGWRCWDVGAGNGSVALRLAGRAGAVLAGDLDPAHIPAHPRIEAVRQDIVRDRWPEPGFDLVHARLVLMHLAAPEEIALRLADSLRPGGVLVLTDWYCDCDAGPVVSAVDARTAEAWRRCHEAVHDLGRRAGMDLAWAPRTAGVFRAAGYAEVTSRVHRADGHGGGPSARLALLHTHMLEAHLGATLTGEDLELIRAGLLDPGFEMVPYTACTTIVRAGGAPPAP